MGSSDVDDLGKTEIEKGLRSYGKGVWLQMRFISAFKALFVAVPGVRDGDDEFCRASRYAASGQARARIVSTQRRFVRTFH